MENLFETIANICRPTVLPVMPLVRIWIKVKTEFGWVYSIEEGDRVYIHNGKLCNCLDKATHQITQCMGRVGDTDLQIHCIDLKTKELSIIKLD